MVKVTVDNKEYEFKSVLICGVEKNKNAVVSGLEGELTDIGVALIERETNKTLQENRLLEIINRIKEDK